MKEKFLSLTFLLLLSLPCFATPSVIIHLTDSTVIVCSLSKEPKMSFSDKSLTLSSVEGSVGQWLFADVDSWNFGDVEDADAVELVKVDKARIYIEEGRLSVEGVSADNVAVYDVGGRLLTPLLNNDGSRINISLSEFSKGTYMLKVNKSSVKFIVQ
jgi:hypothetical protein